MVGTDLLSTRENERERITMHMRKKDVGGLNEKKRRARRELVRVVSTANHRERPKRELTESLVQLLVLENLFSDSSIFEGFGNLRLNVRSSEHP